MPDLLHAPVVDPSAPGERNGRPAAGGADDAGSTEWMRRRVRASCHGWSSGRHRGSAKAPTTTIDALEREFEQRKKRELAQAREAGGAMDETANVEWQPGRRRLGRQLVAMIRVRVGLAGSTSAAMGLRFRCGPFEGLCRGELDGQ